MASTLLECWIAKIHLKTKNAGIMAPINQLKCDEGPQVYFIILQTQSQKDHMVVATRKLY